MKKINGSALKSLGKLIKIIFVIIISFFLINIIYIFSSYKRIPDYTNLNIQKANNLSLDKVILDKGTTYKAISYNIGFSAYLPDFTFFMDGGSQSWAKSKSSVIETTNNISGLLKSQNADFISLQEVDSDSTRTYHIDETKLIHESLNYYNNVNCCCYDSPFLFWPLYQPHGSSTSNLMTLSKFIPQNDALRRQFPVDNSFTKILDYDRCYSVTRFPILNGKELVYYTTHMSAYSQDVKTAENQIKQLVEDMQTEYEKDNYCICGADFNKQLIKNPQDYYPDYKIYIMKNFPSEFLEGTNVNIVVPFNTDNPVGTCRDAGQVWDDNNKICNIDGFLVSSNIKIIESDVIDTNFAYSDHNPVYMTFQIL